MYYENKWCHKMKILLVLIGVFGLVLAKDAASTQSGRIGGGAVTTIDRYPFMAAMLTNGGVGTVFTQACGASILTTTSLLSSALCYVNPTTGVAHNVAWWQARVGTVFAANGGVVLNIRLITLHEAFSHVTLANNVAVLRTVTPIVYIPNLVGPASISGTAYMLLEQEPVIAVGWGLQAEGGLSSNELREVQIWTVPQDACVSRYADLAQAVPNTVVCAGWHDVGIRGQCKGDEGSPLLHHNVVVGIHSWSQDCGSYRYPALNTRVSSYTGWIIQHATAV